MAKENTIWIDYKNSNDSTKKIELKQQLILKYINLVKIIAGKLYNFYGSTIEFDDLTGYGVIGLIDAIDKYDYTKNIKFETYASIRIRGAIIDQIRSLDWIPRSIRQKSKLLRNANTFLENKLNREPTHDELAEYLNKTKKEVIELLDETSVYNMVSIEDEISENFKIQIADERLEASPEYHYEHKEQIQELQKLIEQLKEREQLIVQLYYYENLTYKEIGEILAISESRVSQIHTKVIEKLKNKL